MKIRMSIEPKSKEELIRLLAGKYHFAKTQENELFRVYEHLLSVVTPYAAYRINHRVTGIPVIDENQTAIVSMTLGEGPDRLQETYLKKEQLDQAYMLECITNEMLLQLYGEFNKLYARFHRRYVQRYVFIGEEIPLTDLTDLLADIQGKKEEEEGAGRESGTDEDRETTAIRGAKEEIRANRYGVLYPSKSVVFYAVLSENPNQACQGICAGCGNLLCENRCDDADVRGREGSENADNPEKQGSSVAAGQSRFYLNYGFQRIFSTESEQRRVADGQDG